MSGGASITSSGTVLGEITFKSRKTYSRRLTASILYLMKELDLTWDDLDLIATGLGPGSFTGLRIGLATSKGFALAHSLDLLGVPTLDTIAENAVLEDQRLICPLMDARRSQVYASLYQPEFPNGPKRILDYLAVPPQELGKILPKENDILFLGDGISCYRTLLQDIFKKRAAFAPSCLWYPKPSATGLLAERMVMEKGERPADPALIMPLYCRLSEAEENKLKK